MGQVTDCAPGCGCAVCHPSDPLKQRLVEVDTTPPLQIVIGRLQDNVATAHAPGCSRNPNDGACRPLELERLPCVVDGVHYQACNYCRPDNPAVARPYPA